MSEASRYKYEHPALILPLSYFKKVEVLINLFNSRGAEAE